MSPTSAGLDADTLLCLCQHELHQGSSGLGREVRGRGGLEVGEDQFLEELERSGRTLRVCVHVCVLRDCWEKENKWLRVVAGNWSIAMCVHVCVCVCVSDFAS